MKVFVHSVANNQSLRQSPFLMLGGFIILSILGYFANNNSDALATEMTSVTNSAFVATPRYALSVHQSEGALIDLGQAIGIPDGQGTKFNRGDSNIPTSVAWDMGQAIPLGTEVCAFIKLEHCTNSTASRSNLTISGGDGFSYQTEQSLTIDNNNYQLFCFTTSDTYQYLKITDDGGCAFRIDYLEWLDDEDIETVGDWNYGCEDGKAVEITGQGLKNNIPATLVFDNGGNIDQVYAEVIYKGNHPGETITIYDDAGTAYTVSREQPGGNSTNVHVYRTVIPSTASISYNNQTASNSAQSFVAYIFRNVSSGAYCNGQFTYQSGFRTTRTLTFDIPTDVEPRDINVEIPVSEMTEDCRLLNITASAGSVTQTVTLEGPDPEQGCCLNITNINLQNVEADATTVTIVIESPTGTDRGCPATSNQDGQSFVVAGAVKVDVECVDCENVSDGGSIGSSESSCEPFDASAVQNIELPSGGAGDLEYQWQKSSVSENGPWTTISGATQVDYNPTYESQTIWYQRTARRMGCSFYVGLSNVIVKVVDEDCTCDIFCPGDVTLDCNDSTDPSNTGYAVVLCGDGSSNDCQRSAGLHILSDEQFENTNTSYSLDQGWEIGSGCNPVCGDGSTINAFIDFTQFYYAYDRSITSPVLDACCIEEVNIDYCLRQDLFTNGNAPVQRLDIEVSINGGAWNSFVNYETVNGQTLDYLESGITVPGAAGNNFRIRFRVSGPGGDFTLGGWGLDNVKIYGNSAVVMKMLQRIMTSIIRMLFKVQVVD